MSERIDHIETIRTALASASESTSRRIDDEERMILACDIDRALASLTALQEERERMWEALQAYWDLDEQVANCEEHAPEMAPESCGECFPFTDDARLKMRAIIEPSLVLKPIDAAIGEPAAENAVLQRCLDHDKHCAQVGIPVPIDAATGTADDQIDPAVVAELRRRIAASGLTNEAYVAAFNALTPEQIRARFSPPPVCHCAGCEPASYPEGNGWRCAKSTELEAERDSLRAELATIETAVGFYGNADELAGVIGGILAKRDELRDELAERNADLEQAVRLGVAHMEDAQASKAELAASQEKVRVLREALKLWDSIGFDFWLTDDEWAAREPDHDDEREWVNVSSVTREALAATPEGTK